MEPVNARTRENDRAAPSSPRLSRSAVEWVLFGLGVAVVAVVLLIDWRRDEARWESIARERLALDAGVVSTLLGERLRAIHVALDGLRENRFWQRGATMSQADIGRRLQTLAGAMGGVRSILIEDRYGIGVSSNRPELVGVDYSSHECFRELRRRADSAWVCLSQPFVTPTGRYTFVLSTMLTDASGEFDGVVTAVLDPTWLTQLLRPLQRRGEDLRLTLVHSKGRVIHSEPTSGPWSGGDAPVPADWWPWVRAADGEQFFVGGEADGRERRVLVLPVAFNGDRPLAVVASRDLPLFRSEVIRGSVDLGAGLALAVGFGAIALVMIQRRRRVLDAVAGRLKAADEAAADKVRDAERDLRLAVESAGLGVWRWDPTNNEVRVSPRFLEMFGLPIGQPVTRASVEAVVHPDDREMAARCFTESLKGGHPMAIEHRVILPDGGVRWIASAAAPYQADDSPRRRLHGIVRDITDVRSLQLLNEESRMKLSALVEQHVAIETASAFAHDLNQPLLAISAYSEAALMLLKRGEVDPEKLRRMVEGSFQQAQRAGGLMHDMSAHLSQAAHMGPAQEAFDLNELIRGCVIEEAARRQDLGIPTLELDPSLPAVLGSRVRTERIIANLLSNAYEASLIGAAPGTRPTLSVSTAFDGKDVLLHVRDSGPGVSPEDADRIFSPFFSTKPSGLGLGLSISRALAESQGGRLWLASTPGPGAEFHLSLPTVHSHAKDLSR